MPSVFVGASCPNKPAVGTMAIGDLEGGQGHTSGFKFSVPTGIANGMMDIHDQHASSLISFTCMLIAEILNTNGFPIDD